MRHDLLRVDGASIANDARVCLVKDRQNHQAEVMLGPVIDPKIFTARKEALILSTKSKRPL